MRTLSMPSGKLTFHSLPAELRNAIYNHALVDDRPLLLPYAYEKKPLREPALLAASRLIRAEATPIFYGSNVFEAPSPASATSFLQRLPPTKIALLRLFRPLDITLPLNVVSRTAPPPQAVPFPLPEPEPESPAAPSVAARQRWIDIICVNINRIVRAGGQGALSAEAVSVPVRTKDGKLVWMQVADVRQFHVEPYDLDDDGTEGEDGETDSVLDLQTKRSRRLGWRIEWREDC